MGTSVGTVLHGEGHYEVAEGEGWTNAVAVGIEEPGANAEHIYAEPTQENMTNLQLKQNEAYATIR